MTQYKTICNGSNCCEVMVSEDGIETILSCTSTSIPNSRMSC
ncbi:MAG: hypothetical protein ABII71_03060 [Candidatus Micrarchaeota archaeon]